MRSKQSNGSAEPIFDHESQSSSVSPLPEVPEKGQTGKGQGLANYSNDLMDGSMGRKTPPDGSNSTQIAVMSGGGGIEDPDGGNLSDLLMDGLNDVLVGSEERMNHSNHSISIVSANHDQSPHDCAYPDFVSTKHDSIRVDGAGYQILNGDYRYFAPYKRWCLFTSEEKQFSLAKEFDVQEVYTQLGRIQGLEKDLRWESDVTHCWVVADADLSHVYYAAPMRSKSSKRIPNNGWISVHGSRPMPLFRKSPPHREDEIESNPNGGSSQGSGLLGAIGSIPEKNEPRDEEDSEEESLSDME